MERPCNDENLMDVDGSSKNTCSDTQGPSCINDEIFQNKKRKKVSRGPKHQVEYIPEPSEYWIAETNSKGASCLDTKVQVLRFAQNPEKEIQCNMTWDPTRIESSEVEKYLEEIKKVWPCSEFSYREELALYYLYLNNYDIIRTLLSVIYNVDELRYLYKTWYDKTGSLANDIIVKPVKRVIGDGENKRILRTLKQKVDYTDRKSITF
ncbi:unnamed protein product [Moneuplotes crassus]|uniref:ELM2 domain-containing protein n=1 Tax=Euplotes crassus TaxID=5936 RepID=A0AAD1USM1_EUPCR|nr:unnamed protein product [Moneuplotes crassus]